MLENGQNDPDTTGTADDFNQRMAEDASTAAARSAYEHDATRFNRQVIEEFRANEGRVGGVFAGAPMLLLTTTGAKSGQPRVAPLVYVMDEGRFAIIASNGGAPTHPDWFHNLRAHPEATVGVGTESFPARASRAQGAERQHLFDRMVEQLPYLARYKQATTRQIPIVVLERIA